MLLSVPVCRWASLSLKTLNTPFMHGSDANCGGHVQVGDSLVLLLYLFTDYLIVLYYSPPDSLTHQTIDKAAKSLKS